MIATEQLLEKIQQHHKDHKAFNNKNWQRVKLMPKLVRGKSILDIGIGNGACVNLFHLMNSFDRVCGVDLKAHSTQKLISDDIEYQEMNISNLVFEENEFDTIICMEVLEHLGAPQKVDEAQKFLGWDLDPFFKGIMEIRRVAKKRLIISVPYNETFPIYHYDIISGHKQIYNNNNLSVLFPKAKFYKFHHWMLIVEDNPIWTDIEILSIVEL